jgi:hypothetical protein
MTLEFTLGLSFGGVYIILYALDIFLKFLVFRSSS